MVNVGRRALPWTVGLGWWLRAGPGADRCRGAIVAPGRFLELDAEGREPAAPPGVTRSEHERSRGARLLGDEAPRAEHQQAPIEQLPQLDLGSVHADAARQL
jgi:hypothetical protein